MAFIDRLKLLLTTNNISKNKLAKELGIAENSVKSWENGSQPSADKLIKICKYFNVSADYLLDIDSQNLAEKEKQIINQYRSLSNYNKGLIEGFIKGLSESEQTHDTEDQRLYS